jgi:hypothetical protein
MKIKIKKLKTEMDDNLVQLSTAQIPFSTLSGSSCRPF